MAHSTTHRRHAKQLTAMIEREEKIAEHIQMGDHYTAEDRKVAEQLEAAEMFRAFLAEEF